MAEEINNQMDKLVGVVKQSPPGAFIQKKNRG